MFGIKNSAGMIVFALLYGFFSGACEFFLYDSTGSPALKRALFLKNNSLEFASSPYSNSFERRF
jgi:hypothetical protein